MKTFAATLQATADQAAAGFRNSEGVSAADCDDAMALFNQVALAAIPTPAEFAALGLNAGAALTAMETTACTNPDFARSHLAQALFRAVLQPVLTQLLDDPAFTAKIEPHLWRTTLAGLGRIEDKIDALPNAEAIADAMVTKLLAALGASGEAARAKGITDAALIGLAQRIAADVTDPEQAFRELERAVKIAIDVQTRAAAGSNSGDLVDKVIRQMAALSAEGQYDEAAETGRSEYQKWKTHEADRQQEARVSGLRLLEAELEQQLLRRDAEAAAGVIAEMIALETPDPTAHFTQLRAIQNKYHVRGRDQGLNLDLNVAIHLAHHCHTTAKDADQRGEALNDLGISLTTRGEREIGTARLEQAVTAYRAALEEQTRDRVPLNWAITQNNLGSALQTLGTRETGTVRLELAVTAYRAALEEQTRDRVPLDRAITQNNLGAVEIAFFDLTKDPAHLAQAETYVQAAREVFLESGADHYVGIADAQLADIAQRRG